MKRQQRRPSMIYERRTSLSLMPALNDCSVFPTSLVEMNEEFMWIDPSVHSQTTASRRTSLDISMNDLCELTGDSITGSFCDASTYKHFNEAFDPFVPMREDIHTNNCNSNTGTSSKLAPQFRAMKRTSLSFLPLCNDTTLGDSNKKNFDAALDSFFHEASEIQPCGPISGMISSLQSTFTNSNPSHSLNFANDYQGRLKELVRQMETSKKSRSKVAMFKTLHMRHEKKQLLKRKLAATGLNTTKSEETRKLLLRTHYFANKASATGTGSPINDTSSSCNAKPISTAAIKDKRRKISYSDDSTRHEQPAARHVSMDTTVNFDDAIPSDPCYNGMNMAMNTNMNDDVNIKSAPPIVSRRVSRRRSNTQPISYAAIKDKRRKISCGWDSTRYEQPAARHVSMDTTVNFDDAIPSDPCYDGMNMDINTHTKSAPPIMEERISRRRSSLASQSYQIQFFADCV